MQLFFLFKLVPIERSGAETYVLSFLACLTPRTLLLSSKLKSPTWTGRLCAPRCAERDDRELIEDGLLGFWKGYM